jgi:hypothetical protein
MQRVDPAIINTNDIKSYLVNTSPRIYVANKELKTIGDADVDVRVIKSANASATMMKVNGEE